MPKDDQRKGVFAKWFDKIDAERRVKAVCKPCWEIKYCPYGPLVEQFPIPEDRDDPRRCRIFGHICPVFSVAEPFTETKELRRISRNISRATQFRVLKRENQVCRNCGQPVADDDIHFDHIIPWSKGGSSDEHNVQLLCSTCNLKKSASFENEYLVEDFREHVNDPVDHEIVDFLLFLMNFAHEFHLNEERYPDGDAIADVMNDGNKGSFEEHCAAIISDLVEFFSSKRPEELNAKLFRVLRERWGFKDGTLYRLKSIAEENELDVKDLLDAEISLVNRLGWVVSLNKESKKKWVAS